MHRSSLVQAHSLNIPLKSQRHEKQVAGIIASPTEHIFACSTLCGGSKVGPFGKVFDDKEESLVLFLLVVLVMFIVLVVFE